MDNVYGKTAGKILIGFALWFVSTLLLAVLLNPFIEGASYFATQLGFIVAAIGTHRWLDWKHKWPLGFTKGRAGRYFFTGAGAAILIVLFSVLILATANLATFEWSEWQTAAITGQLFIFLLVATGEEVFFRGYVFGVIRKAFHSNAAVLISTLLFAGIHLINPGAFSRPFSYIIIEISNIFLLGLLFALARLYSGSLWMPIGLHFFINALQSSVFGFLNGGKEVDSLMEPVFTSTTIWNGGGYGLESSLALTPVLLLVLIIMAAMHTHQTAKKEKNHYRRSVS